MVSQVAWFVEAGSDGATGMRGAINGALSSSLGWGRTTGKALAAKSRALVAGL